MSEQPTEFSSSTLKINMTRQPGCRVVAEIEISPEAVEAAYQHTVKELNREISIPGFRKGRAPPALVEQRLGSDIKRRWRENIAQIALKDAFALMEVGPRSQEALTNLDINNLERKSAANLRVEFETAPEISSMDLDGASFKRLSVPEVTDKQVSHMLHSLRLENSTLKDLEESRPVAEGDLVTLDLELFNDESSAKLLDGKIWQATAEHMPAWIYRQVLGMMPQQTVEVTCELDDALILSLKEGAPMPQARLTVKEIKEGEIAPMDDALAAKHGCKTVAELEQGVRKHLEGARERQIREDMQQQVEEYLLEKYSFDVPYSLYHKNAQMVVEKELRALKRQEGWEENFAQQAETVKERVETDLKRSIRRYYILRSIVQQYSIEVSRDEVIMELLQEQMSGEQPRDEKDEERFGRIYNLVLQRKALEHLAELATVA